MATVNKQKVSSITALKALTGISTGQLIEVDSYYGDGNGGGNTFKKVSSGTGNDGTIIVGGDSSVYQAMIHGRSLDMKVFGVIETSNTVADNTDKLNAMAIFVSASSIYRDIVLNEALTVDDTIYFKRCGYEGNNNTITYDGSDKNADVLVFGETGENLYYDILQIKSSRTVDATATAGIGVKIFNSQGTRISIAESRGSRTAVKLYADDSFSNNVIDLGLLVSSKIYLRLESDGLSSGYINENRFIKGTFSVLAGNPYSGITQIYIGTAVDTNIMNNNIFEQPNLGTGVSGVTLINIESGRDNKFYDIRNEGGENGYIELGTASQRVDDNVIDFYVNDDTPEIRRNNVLDRTLITFKGQQERKKPLIDINPTDLYYHSNYAADTAKAWMKSLKGHLVKNTIIATSAVNEEVKVTTNADGMYLLYNDSILGAFFKVDKVNGYVDIDFNCPGWRAEIKVFDVNGDFIEDGFSCSNIVSFHATYKVYYTASTLTELTKVRFYPDSTAKYIFVGVATGTGIYGKDVQLSGSNVSLLYKPVLNINRLASEIPDSGYHEAGTIYYDEANLGTLWICTVTGDFDIGGSEPTFVTKTL